MPKTRTFLTALVLVLATPSAAGASVILGPDVPNPEPETSQAINWQSGSLLFTAVAPAGSGVQLAAPFDGVITAWQLYTDDTSGETGVRLRTLAPLGAKTYVVTGAGEVEPLAPFSPSGPFDHNVHHAFSSQLPIAAGEIVGVTMLRAATSSAIEPVLPVGEGWHYDCLGGSCEGGGPDGTAVTPTTATGEQWLAMNATLEADADGDGLGDETQDSCVGACLPSPTTTVINNPPAQPQSKPAITKRCKKGLVKRAGKCVKKRKKRSKNK